MIAAIAASASSTLAATTTPLPAASPSALTTSGAPRRRTKARAACGVAEPLPQRGRDAAASQISLVKLLLPSSCAAAPVGRQQRMPAAPARRRARPPAGPPVPAPPDRPRSRARTAPARRHPSPRSARSRRSSRCPDCPARTTAWSAAATPTAPSTAHARVRPIRPPAPASHCLPPFNRRGCSIALPRWTTPRPADQHPGIHRLGDLRRGEAHAGSAVRPRSGCAAR